ncbi:hypothetical protein [Polaribacter sp. Asnod1-A03]|uniref:hypothetical protein n=1 Tax=Polaribacter sp. Asnod1-A03 TaxID=3160581 RepID=UPI003865E0FC
MIKKYLLIAICTFSFSCFSQDIEVKEVNNKVRLNFIPVSMPSDKYPELEQTMGLAGLHYQIPLNNWLYAGTAFYFAATGDQGGLFTLGAELGVNQKLYKNLYFDGNFHFGGGGGYRQYINDGAFINSNLGLQYKRKNFSFGVQYSYLNFYTGVIKDDAISFFIEIPSLLEFTDYKNTHKEITSNNSIKFNSTYWKEPVKNAQQIRFDFFKPFGNSKKDDGSTLNETLYLVGFEYQKYISDNTFLFVHTDAIYKGLRAGFMDLFFGAGYQPYETKYINLFTKLGIGAAGGRIALEGGITIYPSAGIDLKITKNMALSGHGGYYRALDGDFEAYTVGLGLKYFGLNGGNVNPAENKATDYTIKGLNFNLQNQTYFDVDKTDDPDNILLVDLQLLAIQIKYDLFKNIYLVGEAGFAYDGRSGGYANGLIGLGAKTNSFLNNKLNLFVDLMAGAGGGAGVDTEEGVVIRPTIGLNYELVDNFSVFASGGKFISPFGNVDANNINIGLSFNFGTLSVNK